MADVRRPQREEELIEQAKRGSDEAFTELVRLHQGRVRAYLGRNLRDPGVVDDLAQEAFFTAYRTFNTYQGDAPLGTWLVGIARHKALVHLRGETRRRARDSRRLEAALAGWRAVALESDPDGPAREERAVTALLDCLKGLPEKSAAMIDWYYYKGVSAVGIGRQLGRDGGVVRMTLRRIRGALRKCVEQQLATESL